VSRSPRAAVIGAFSAAWPSAILVALAVGLLVAGVRPSFDWLAPAIAALVVAAGVLTLVGHQVAVSALQSLQPRSRLAKGLGTARRFPGRSGGRAKRGQSLRIAYTLVAGGRVHRSRGGQPW
jgi:hypothetical protein